MRPDGLAPCRDRLLNSLGLTDDAPMRTRVAKRSLLLMPVCGGLASCEAGTVDAIEPFGQAKLLVLSDATALMPSVMLSTFILLLVFGWWWLQVGNRHSIDRSVHSYHEREPALWPIPLVLALFLGNIAWVGIQQLQHLRSLGAHQRPIQVEVTALDSRWLFVLPEQGIASLNTLTIPEGVPVHFRLTSSDATGRQFISPLGRRVSFSSASASTSDAPAVVAARFQNSWKRLAHGDVSGAEFSVHATSISEFKQWVESMRPGTTSSRSVASFAALRAHP